MTTNNSRKKLIRQRMDETGEKYTTARKYIPVDENTRINLAQTLTVKDLIPNTLALKRLTTALKAPGLILLGGHAAAGKTSLQHVIANEQIRQDKKVLHLFSSREYLYAENNDNYTKIDIDALPNQSVANHTDYVHQQIKELAQTHQVIVLDEIRSLENVKFIQPYLDTHTVISSIHSNNVLSAIDRIVSIYNYKNAVDIFKILDKVSLVIAIERIGNLVTYDAQNTISSALLHKRHYTVVPVTDKVKKIYENNDLREAKILLEALFIEENILTVQQHVEQLAEQGLIKAEKKTVTYYKLK